MVLCSALARAHTDLTPETTHFLGLWGSFGYAGWLHTMPEIKPLSGVTPSVGVGYRLLHNRFVFQTGVEGQFTWVKGRIPEIERTERMNDMDVPNEQFTMHVNLYDYSDVSQAANVQIPLLIGYEGGRFYALGGVVAGFNVYARATSSATMKTTGEYDSYIGIIENMPNHGFETKAITSGSRNFNMGVNLMAHLELGARVDQFNPKKGFNVHNHSYRVYMGAFAQYGVLNVHSATSQGPMTSMDFSHGVQTDLVPVMLCEQMRNGKVHPLTVGIKCTVMFELPQFGKSYIYDYYKREDRKRGGNQGVKY